MVTPSTESVWQVGRLKNLVYKRWEPWVNHTEFLILHIKSGCCVYYFAAVLLLFFPNHLHRYGFLSYCVLIKTCVLKTLSCLSPEGLHIASFAMTYVPLPSVMNLLWQRDIIYHDCS